MLTGLSRLTAQGEHIQFTRYNLMTMNCLHTFTLGASVSMFCVPDSVRLLTSSDIE